VVRLMACGKPSGGFSHNPAEGYRMPSQLKITQNPCIQKKGLKFMTKGRIIKVREFTPFGEPILKAQHFAGLFVYHF